MFYYDEIFIISIAYHTLIFYGTAPRFIVDRLMPG